MLYTVKEMSELANVTIKALHHYHKIGLLFPCEVSGAGYRLYGRKELERLQEILFYRELDLPLEQIKQLMDGDRDRLTLLSAQREQLLVRKNRLACLIQTIEESISCAVKGEHMDISAMFKGFESEEEWRDALAEQNEHLKETYNYDMLEANPIQAQSMNEMAAEAEAFIQNMAYALENLRKADDENVTMLIRSHIEFLNRHGHQLSAADFASQARFFLEDDFHRAMLESRHIGLAYYLCFAAESFAAL